MTDATTTKARTDRNGFPIQTCSRCGGSGRYSYNSIDGDRCYGCSGTGTTYTRKALPHVTAWKEAIRKGRQPVVQDLKVGDIVVADFTYRKTAGVPWATVTKIEDTGEACGWSLVDGEQRVTSTYQIVTLDTGETRRLGGGFIIRRQANVPVAPFVEAATR